MVFTVKNKTEEHFLRQPAPAFDFDSKSKKEIRELVKRLRREMKRAYGVGLSANQIGFTDRVFVAEVAGKFYAVFNPEIVKTSEETLPAEEGCLSVPEIFGPVERAKNIIISGFDQNGKKIKIKAWGLLARVFQHEVDHLNGGIFTDKAKTLYKIKEKKQE